MSLFDHGKKNKGKLIKGSTTTVGIEMARLRVRLSGEIKASIIGTVVVQ